MPRPFSYTLGPFTGGQVLGLAPHLVPPTDAVSAIDVDNTGGSIKGLYGIGDIVYSPVNPTPGSVTYIPGFSWIENSYNEFICYDTPLPGDGGSGDSVVYMTHQGSVPQIYSGANVYDLGIDAPTVEPNVSDGASGGARAYAITFKNSTTGWESNPFAPPTFTTTNCTGAVMDLTPYTVSETGVDTICIYGTTAGSLVGTKYFLTEVALGVDFTDNAGTYPGVTSAPLNWLAGGNPDNEDFPFDHSPAPSLNVISDAVHAFAEGFDTFGQGIIFGAVGKWLTWSMAGYPAYWPTTNWQKLDADIEAIISDVGVTYVFTRNDVYAVSGLDDTSLTPRKTGAAFGVRSGGGHTVKRTPYGILFLGPLGLAVFDGETTRYLTEGLATYGTFDEDDAFEAAYHDNYYWLLNKTTGTMFYFDLAEWPRVKFYQDSLYTGTLTNLAVSPYADPAGFYVLSAGGLYPWMPRRGDEIAGAGRLDWTWTTPNLTLGEPTRYKKFRRFWMRNAGSLTVKFYVDGVLLHFATTSGWLPVSAYGRTLQLEILGTNPLSELFDLTIEGDFENG